MMAPAWKRALTWSAWLLGGALAIPIVCYVALLLINWRDQPPSEAALRLAADYRNRPAIPDTDNAYVYAMGFSVAPDIDPREAGIRRIEWTRALAPDVEYPPPGDPVTNHEKYRSSRSAAARAISDACMIGFQDCATALKTDDEEILAWIASEQWLLDRYATLLQHSGWVETAPFDIRAPLPSYEMLIHGQQLLIAKAYIFAGQRNDAAVRELLGNDARFWRQALASSDIVVTKMFAAGALRRTFGMGNLVLRRLPAELQLTAIPEEWTTPLTVAERSMLRSLTGEWVSGRLMLEQNMATVSAGLVQMELDQEIENGFIDAVLRRAALPMFQLQDTGNRQAEMFVRASEALDVPLENLPEGVDRARQIFADASADNNPFANLYNPIGRILIAIGAGNYPEYPPRIADVEGVRRAAVLTTELRARGVTQQNISAELAASKTRAPYGGEPFTWVAEKQAIMFVGMEPGERGQHAFLY